MNSLKEVSMLRRSPRKRVAKLNIPATNDGTMRTVSTPATIVTPWEDIFTSLTTYGCRAQQSSPDLFLNSMASTATIVIYWEDTFTCLTTYGCRAQQSAPYLFLTSMASTEVSMLRRSPRKGVAKLRILATNDGTMRTVSTPATIVIPWEDIFTSLTTYGCRAQQSSPDLFLNSMASTEVSMLRMSLRKRIAKLSIAATNDGTMRAFSIPATIFIHWRDTFTIDTTYWCRAQQSAPYLVLNSMTLEERCQIFCSISRMFFAKNNIPATNEQTMNTVSTPATNVTDLLGPYTIHTRVFSSAKQSSPDLFLNRTVSTGRTYMTRKQRIDLNLTICKRKRKEHYDSTLSLRKLLFFVLLSLSFIDLWDITIALPARDVAKRRHNAAAYIVHLTGVAVTPNIGTSNHQYILLTCSCKGLPFGTSAEFLKNGKTLNNLRLFNGTCFSINPLSVCTSSCGCSTNNLETIFSMQYQGQQNSTVLSCRIRYKSLTKKLLITYESTWTQQKSYSRIIDSTNDQNQNPRRQPTPEKDAVRGGTFNKSPLVPIAVCLVIGLCCIFAPILWLCIRLMEMRDKKPTKRHNKSEFAIDDYLLRISQE